ncbi:MAG: amidase family protein [bacterium]
MKDELCRLSAEETAALIRKKQISPVEVVVATLERIERLNPELNAFCTVAAESARKEAMAAEKAVMRSGAELGPLHGIPFSVKDLLATKGVRTTWGSKIYAGDIPDEDAPAVGRMRKAGAIMIGKTNTPEFGWLGVTHNRLFGITRNPWNPEMTSGGSSGGAAAAVASGMGPIALGSDVGGSIRIPASFCGIFGFKPSYGRVPIYPHGTYWSMAHVGPMTRTVRDAALMMNVLAGPDERDQYSLPDDGTDYVKESGLDLKGLKMAWSPALGRSVVDSEVKTLCENAAMRFSEFGCEVEAVDPKWPDPHCIWSTLFYGGCAARAAPLLEDHRQDLEPGLVHMTEEIMRWPSGKHIRACGNRPTFYDSTRKFFSIYGLLLAPTVICPPFDAGLEHPREVAGRTLEPYRWLSATYPLI